MASSLAVLAGLWSAAIAGAAPGSTVVFSKPADPTAAPPAMATSENTAYFSKPADPVTPANVGRTTQFFKPPATPYRFQPTQVQPVPANARLPLSPGGGIYLTNMQQPNPQGGQDAATGGDLSQEFAIDLIPPGKSKVFGMLDSEARLQERIRQETRQRPGSSIDRVVFPDEPVLNDPYVLRCFPPATGIVEPFYLCYCPLLFEQKNAERWGWDLGPVQPFLCAGKFFADVAMLPYKLGSLGRDAYDCNTGYCLPGDPVPLRVFPVGLTFTGVLSEAATALVLMAIFP